MRYLTYIAYAVITFISVELITRALIPEEFVFQSWFSGGPHQPDEDFGFAYRFNYDGEMRHQDKVPSTRLQLDEYGFRKPSQGEGITVDIAGGASMVMSYGLEDQHAIHAQLAAHSRYAGTVRNTAWTGQDTYRGYLSWRRSFADDPPQLLILAVYTNNANVFKDVPEDLKRQPTKPQIAELFLFHENRVVPHGRIANALGPSLLNSYLLHEVVRDLDRLLFPDYPTYPSVPAIPESERAASAPMAFQRFVTAANKEVNALGSELMIAFLPVLHAPEGYYDELITALPAGVAYVDGQARLQRPMTQQGTIANGHYGRDQADEVGRILGEAVDRHFAAGSDEPSYR